MTDHPCELRTGEEPQRRRHLVVPASARMQLGPALRGELGHPPFDRSVDVLVGGEIREAVAGQLVAHLIERLDQQVRLASGEDPRSQETVDVCNRAPHVAGGQPFVKGQASCEHHQGIGWGSAHPVCPQGHSAPPWRADQVWIPRPNNRTKPSASSWRNASAVS